MVICYKNLHLFVCKEPLQRQAERPTDVYKRQAEGTVTTLPSLYKELLTLLGHPPYLSLLSEYRRRNKKKILYNDDDPALFSEKCTS